MRSLDFTVESLPANGDLYQYNLTVLEYPLLAEYFVLEYSY